MGTIAHWSALRDQREGCCLSFDYQNPNTGEVVETRGGNQEALKACKDEHGAETVESWLVRTED